MTCRNHEITAKNKLACDGTINVIPEQGVAAKVLRQPWYKEAVRRGKYA